MVVDLTRWVVVNKHVQNSFTATKVLNDLTSLLADELEGYAELLKDNGDVYTQCAGLLKAAQIVRQNPETDLS
jgi:hypothetical protein